MKCNNFREALQLLKESDHGININEVIYDEFYPIHLSCAAGELVLPPPPPITYPLLSQIS